MFLLHFGVIIDCVIFRFKSLCSGESFLFYCFSEVIFCFENEKWETYVLWGVFKHFKEKIEIPKCYIRYFSHFVYQRRVLKRSIKHFSFLFGYLDQHSENITQHFNPKTLNLKHCCHLKNNFKRVNKWNYPSFLGTKVVRFGYCSNQFITTCY